MPTEAAHTGQRGLGQKAPDREAIPLCAVCHRLGPFAYHRIGKRFYETHALDREALVAALNHTWDRLHTP